MKKLLALTLAITIGTLAASYSAPTASAATPPDSCFAFNSATGTITEYYNNENNNSSNPACPKDVDIPSQIGGITVESIGSSAFRGKQLTSATIPNSITYIGNLAFEKAELSQVSLPNNLAFLGDGAFSYNHLTTVTIPGSLTTISEDAFHSNQLASISIGQGVASIKYGAFAYNKLTEVNMPSSLTDISPDAFQGQNPWGGDVYDCSNDDGGWAPFSVGNEQVLGTSTSDAVPCLSSDDPDEVKAVLDNIWYANLILSDSNNSNNLHSRANHNCVAYDDDPLDPQCTSLANLGGHIVNGAKLNLDYVDQTNNSLRTTQAFVGRLDDGSYVANYYVSQGPTIPMPTDPFSPTPVELSAIDQVLSASYFQIGDIVTIDPPAIDGYTTPPIKTFVLGAATNNESYVYTQASGSSTGAGGSAGQGSSDDRLAETGVDARVVILLATTAVLVPASVFVRRLFAGLIYN